MHKGGHLLLLKDSLTLLHYLVQMLFHSLLSPHPFLTFQFCLRKHPITYPLYRQVMELLTIFCSRAVFLVLYKEHIWAEQLDLGSGVTLSWGNTFLF